ncbi:MAG: zeta toxin family protein [Bryobacterales bacterium]
MAPKMIVVAGPPGGGKSTLFPVVSFGVACFNADDRAAELNGASYAGIPTYIRSAAKREFEVFVLECIERRASFPIETTLRSGVTFDQAERAKMAGFTTEMRYLALRDFSMHAERVKSRADAGGHSASEAALREIYLRSLAHLPKAIDSMDDLWAYDNSAAGGPPRLVLQSEKGVIRFLANDWPGWLAGLDLS